MFVKQVVEQSYLFTNITAVNCSAGHSNFTWIVESAFNCLAKNELKRFNDRKSDPPAKMSRTVKKLSRKVLKQCAFTPNTSFVVIFCLC